MPTQTISDAEQTTFLPEIPDPQEVRERLGQCLRESRILRQLLRVSEKAAQEREMQQGVSHAR